MIEDNGLDMRILSTKETLRTPVFAVHDTIARDDDGFEVHRSVVSHQGSAVILPVDAAGRVMLVSQFRLPVGGHVWELAAGRIDPGEKPLGAARRELREETGLRAMHWKRLATIFPTPGYVSEKMHLFLATGLREGRAAPMEDERIEAKWFTRRDLEEWVDKGRIPDGKTLAGLLLYWRMMDRQKRRPQRTTRGAA